MAYILQARKKGLFTDCDKQERLKHVHKMNKELKIMPDFYMHHVAFYINGLSFVRKYNPCSEASKPLFCEELYNNLLRLLPGQYV